MVVDGRALRDGGDRRPPTLVRYHLDDLGGGGLDERSTEAGATAPAEEALRLSDDPPDCAWPLRVVNPQPTVMLTP